MKRSAYRLALIFFVSFAFCNAGAFAATRHKRVYHHHHHRQTHGHVAAKAPAKAAPKHPRQVCNYSVLKTHTAVGIELRRVKHCFSGEK